MSLGAEPSIGRPLLSLSEVEPLNPSLSLGPRLPPGSPSAEVALSPLWGESLLSPSWVSEPLVIPKSHLWLMGVAAGLTGLALWLLGYIDLRGSVKDGLYWPPTITDHRPDTCVI